MSIRNTYDRVSRELLSAVRVTNVGDDPLRGKQCGIARQVTLKPLANLTLKLGLFLDQIEAMPGQESWQAVKAE
jgi:hypothetical protein